MGLKQVDGMKSKTIGQVFTPSFIAKFIVKNCMNFIKTFENENVRKQFLSNMKVLEPSAGKGVFLDNLIQNNFNNIVAYEIDEKLKNQLLQTYSEVYFKFENVLGSDMNEKFDLIIGNPPYLGQNYNAEIFQDYVKKYPICKQYFVGNMDLFYYFIHLGILKLKPGGILSFITTNYWITKSKKTGIKFLKPHVLDECYLLQYVDLSNLKPFKGARGQHNCIFVLQKKTEEEKRKKINKNISVIQIGKILGSNASDRFFNKKIFNYLVNNKDSVHIKKYTSALTNNDLKREGSWNLLYPVEVKAIVDKIEDFCKINGKISYLKDFFVVRNGIIFIKDDYFILTEGKELKINDNVYFVKINGQFVRISEDEKKKLKKIYKSKSIKPYGFIQDDYIGYAIFFNKNQFKIQHVEKRNETHEKNYPVLTAYLKQFEDDLKDILVNAKENPDDLFFSRRGAFIRKQDERNEGKLVDLEPFYDQGKKIFFKYISPENIFGFSDSSYYATSDTYFLWPKFKEREIDYLFMLAYLNSLVVSFLFKAKNLSIKRSKTKLEYSLPIPDLNRFISEDKVFLIELIRFFSSCLIKMNLSSGNDYSKILSKKFSHMNSVSYFNGNEKLIQEISGALENNERNFIQRVIDTLFFQLFELEQIEMDFLIKKYY